MHKYLIILAGLLISSVKAKSIRFCKNSSSCKTLNLAKFKTLKERNLYNIYRKNYYTYQGVDLLDVLVKAYGKDWQSHKIIMFKSKDGSIQSSSIEDILHHSRRKNKVGFLSIKEKGKKGFSSFVRAGKNINPAPAYLVWTNFSETSRNHYASPLKWPYQLIEINLR